MSWLPMFGRQWETKQEAQKRQQDFVGYQINNEVMANAKSDAIVLHCLPAREEEITTEVFGMQTSSLMKQKIAFMFKKRF